MAHFEPATGWRLPQGEVKPVVEGYSSFRPGSVDGVILFPFYVDTADMQKIAALDPLLLRYIMALYAHAKETGFDPQVWADGLERK